MPSHDRLLAPGSSLTAGWQALDADEGEAPDAECFACEVTLGGQASALELRVADSDWDGTLVAGSSHALDLTAGARLHRSGRLAGSTRAALTRVRLQARRASCRWRCSTACRWAQQARWAT